MAPALTTIERTRPALELVHVPQTIHLRRLERDLRVGGLRHHRQALLLDLVAGGQLLHLVAGPAGLVGRNELLGHERFGGLGVPLGVEIGGAGARDLGFLGEPLRGEVGAKVDLVGPGDGELALGFKRLELHVGIAQLEEHGLGLHLLPRLRQPPLHPSGGDRRDVADPLGHQRSRATHLDDERAALDRVDPDGRAIHARRRRLEPMEAQRGQHDRGEHEGAIEELLPAAPDGGPRNVHAASLWRGIRPGPARTTTVAT